MDGPVEVKGALDAMVWGLRTAWACRRVLALILAANLLVAAFVVYPLLGPMDASLSWHPEAARIGRQIDFRWWTDWTVGSAALVGGAVHQIGVAAFAIVLLSTFFAGGLLEAMRHGPRPGLTFEPMPDPCYQGAVPEWRAAAPGPASVRNFLRSSAARFPRFLALLILSLPCYGLVHAVLNRAASLGLDRLLEHVEDERIGVLLTAGRAILFVLAFQSVTVLFEYARAHEVLKPGAPLGALLGLPVRLLRTRPGAFLGIEASAFLLQTAAMLTFIPVEGALGRWPLLAATAGFAAMQVFLFLRLWIRSGAQAAQLRLARSGLRA